MSALKLGFFLAFVSSSSRYVLQDRRKMTQRLSFSQFNLLHVLHHQSLLKFVVCNKMQFILLAKAWKLNLNIYSSFILQLNLSWKTPPQKLKSALNVPESESVALFGLDRSAEVLLISWPSGYLYICSRPLMWFGQACNSKQSSFRNKRDEKVEPWEWGEEVMSGGRCVSRSCCTSRKQPLAIFQPITGHRAESLGREVLLHGLCAAWNV